jgi:chromate transporter
VLALSIAYAATARLPAAVAVFDGIRAAGLALVIEALMRIAKRALRGPLQIAVALASFVAIFAFAVPFPLIVAGAALIGWLRPARGEAPAAAAAPVPLGNTLRTAGAWLALWVVPLAALAALLGPRHLIAQLAWFFSKLALVTFGGAYAVLAYMSQEVVTGRGWLAPGQMLDGLGLAETTPGPLILVTEFVGFVAAHRAHPEAPYAYGLLGAAVALWATFVPCFLWIFTGAPYVRWLGTRPRLQEGLAAITAAVLGVILNLTVWLGLHVLFARVGEWRAGPLRLAAPEWATVEWRMVALVAASAILLMRFRWSVHAVLGIMALAALATG